MHRARAFFFVCAGIFLLALSYLLGARNARAQLPRSTVTDRITARALDIVDGAGNRRIALGVDGAPTISLFDRTGSPRAVLMVLDIGPALALQGKTGKALLHVDMGPTLDLEDSKGYMASLGTKDLDAKRTGTTVNRSAASLVFFGKDSLVIWSAPPQ